MKTKNFTFICILAVNLLSFNSIYSQAFHKGALLVSISEGSTKAKYSTSSNSSPSRQYSSEINGVRDPFFVEFGLCNRIGIGFSSGNDIFKVNSNEFYGFKTAHNLPLEVKTSEFTFDLNYHMFSNQKIDCSVYGSFGSFSVAFKESLGENKINYMAKGSIVRAGTKFRYYFWNRLGALAMLSWYSGNATKPTAQSKMPEGQNYSTSIKGVAMEVGLCFRFF
jgi:hypothetical protein